MAKCESCLNVVATYQVSFGKATFVTCDRCADDARGSATSIRPVGS